MLFLSLVKFTSALDFNKKYNVSLRDSPNEYLKFHGNNLGLSNIKNIVTFKSEDKDRISMLIDGRKVCRDGNKIGNCKSELKRTSDEKIFLVPAEGGYKFKWGRMNPLITFSIDMCMEVKQDNKVRMERCSSKKNNQVWMIEEDRGDSKLPKAAPTFN